MENPKNFAVVSLEGYSTNRPLLFDGSNYQFLSNRMSILMRSCDYQMWDVIVDGHFVLMMKIRESEKLVSKEKSEWINGEIKKIQVNFKAIKTLYCALNPMKFNQILTYKIAKKIWDKLRVTHKGTT